MTHRGVESTETGKAKRIATLRASAVMGQDKASIQKFKPDRPLTEKQREFVKLWASGESPKTAAARAGFSTNSTIDWKMRNDPAILRAYYAEKAKYEAAADMTREKFMAGLVDAAAMARMQGDPTAAVGAWREIGKACGYYEPIKVKIDLTLSGNLMYQRLNTLSDAELLKLIEAPVIEGESTRVE